MIVVCPACRQRYRHAFPGGVAASTAHCSGCDERFPLSPSKAPYRIVAGGLQAPGSAVAGFSGATVPIVVAPVARPPETPTAAPPLAIDLPIHAPVAIPAVREAEAVEERPEAIVSREPRHVERPPASSIGRALGEGAGDPGESQAGRAAHAQGGAAAKDPPA